MRDHLIEKGITLVYDKDVLGYIARESFSEKYGTRNMRRYIEKNIEDPIANMIIDAFPDKLAGVSVKLEDNKLSFASI